MGGRIYAQRDLNATLEPVRAQHDLPALAGAIVTSDGLVAIGAVGVRKYGDRAPVTLNDQFHLGSDTKAMTATVVATLVEEGKLKWNTTLPEVFPDFKDKMHPSYRQVTLEHLLAHRAGFSNASAPAGKTLLDIHRLSGSTREQRRAYLEMVLREPPVAEPGSKYLYSNRSYAVAGAMAEEAANLSWEDLMESRLFKPLKMATCGFGAMGTPDKLDQPWQHTVVQGVPKPIPPGPLSDNPIAIAPAARIHCSIGDWAKYIASHLRGEQGKIGLLKPETFKKLHTPPFGGDYAFGWIVVGSVLTHDGSNTLNYASARLIPKRNLGFLVMTNEGGEDAKSACYEAMTAMMNFFKQSSGSTNTSSSDVIRREPTRAGRSFEYALTRIPAQPIVPAYDSCTNSSYLCRRWSWHQTLVGLVAAFFGWLP